MLKSHCNNNNEKKGQLLGREPTSLELIGHRGIVDKIFVYITSHK